MMRKITRKRLNKISIMESDEWMITSMMRELKMRGEKTRRKTTF